MSVYVVKLGSDHRDAYLGPEGRPVRREYARRFSAQHAAREEMAVSGFRFQRDWTIVRLRAPDPRTFDNVGGPKEKHVSLRPIIEVGPTGLVCLRLPAVPAGSVSWNGEALPARAPTFVPEEARELAHELLLAADAGDVIHRTGQP